MIPPELTLVISYADICPPLAVRTPVGNETHILKDKYAVSLLSQMPLEDVLNCLHRNHLQKYTTSTIKNTFKSDHYIYSFMCDQDLLSSILENRNCLLIIPESLIGQVDIDELKANIYVDKGC